ncbi:MAG: ATP-binding protein [Ignavibacteria bacterium]|nr:ATP-binding protein [Ignavibacteria bacterium]
MSSKLPLKTKLAFWYGSIVAITILAYGFYTYLSVSTELFKNLDASISRVVSALDLVFARNENIKGLRSSIRTSQDRFALLRELEQERFVGPIRPSVQKEKLIEDDIKEIWSAIFEHILLNPKNFFVQVADTNNQIVWRSQNLQNDTLPTLLTFSTLHQSDTTYVPAQGNDSLLRLKMEIPYHYRLDSILTNYKVMNIEVRLMVRRTNHAIISAAYILEDLYTTLNRLFVIQIVAIPFILLVSVLGGWIMSTISLKPIDIITKTAEAITARNLNKRLPELPTNDEVGHLIRTLNNMIERIEQSFDQIKKFASDASHELRTPLTILQGELEIALHSKKTPQEYEEILVSALEEVGRLSNVVETILELSKAETGQIEVEFKYENISKIAQEVVDDISIIAESKQIKIFTNIDENIYLPIDGPRIHQALLNLLDNAAKYSGTGGKILFEVKRNQEFVEIIVEDNGIGIPKEELPYIFNRMYRVRKSGNKEVKGFGLGLSIVKWIVEAHKGLIEVESEVNKFTRFKVKLPLEQPEPMEN